MLGGRLPASVPPAYAELLQRLDRMDALTQSAYLLEWDQHTYMPPGGVPGRSRELSTISTLRHEIFTAPETVRLVERAEKEASGDDERAVLREVRHDLDRATKVPGSLVETIAKESSEAFPVWVEAKQKSRFALFQPRLERLIELRRRYAAHVDASKPPYEVLFHDYEPWIPIADARRNLAALREGLRPLIARAVERKAARPTTLKGAWPAEGQMAVARRVVEMLGYDFQHGRLDVSPHPFSVGNPFDARITTRFEPDDPTQGLLAAIHEAGHAMYMQGLPKDKQGSPLGDARDLVVHESQSRLWENHVGRSREFWERALPLLRETFPNAVPGVTAEQAWRVVNHVEPTLIRVYADELTYHMHIALRFDLELDLVEGRLHAREVPQAWNDRMQKDLGVTPPDDAQGCLQDMHWSTGSFGYFPTYSLGSMLAAQLHASFERATRAPPTDYRALKAWLLENVHQHGKRYKTGELIERATGQPLSPEPFLQYARAKYATVWGE